MLNRIMLAVGGASAVAAATLGATLLGVLPPAHADPLGYDLRTPICQMLATGYTQEAVTAALTATFKDFTTAFGKPDYSWREYVRQTARSC